MISKRDEGFLFELLQAQGDTSGLPARSPTCDILYSMCSGHSSDSRFVTFVGTEVAQAHALQNRSPLVQELFPDYK